MMEDPLTRFATKVAVVTGAASGIGYETAALLASEGAKVFAVDLDPASSPPACHQISVDVSDPGAVHDMVETAMKVAGRIDILINNAGIGSTADPLSCTVEEWDRVFSVNARGVFLGIQHVLPHMLDRREGVIVNTASVAGLIGLRDRTAYCASKGAVVSLTKQVAVQYAGSGVRCNCVCPGTVDSPWVGRLLEATADPIAMRASLVERQPLGRLGTPVEIAKAIAYLASDDASFITGSCLIIDGGILAG